MPKPTSDIIQTPEQFVHWSDELTDSESTRAVRIVAEVQIKYQYKLATAANLEALRDETLTRLAEMGVLAEFDVSPCFYGEPPICEFRGKISTDAIHKHGFDHEQKQYEVQKAADRGESYLGEKEPVNSRRPKKNDT